MKKINTLKATIIVREFPEVKDKLKDEATANGFNSLSDYIRSFWMHLQDE